MTRLRFYLAVTALLVCPLIALGQGDGLGAWWDRPIVRNLGLSGEQLAQIRAVVRESRDRLIRLRGDVKSAEAEVRDELDEEKVDSRKVEAAIERVVASRGELMRAVSLMSMRLRLILTQAQWQELRRREERRLPPAQSPGRLGPALKRPLSFAPPAPQPGAPIEWMREVL